MAGRSAARAPPDPPRILDHLAVVEAHTRGGRLHQVDPPAVIAFGTRAPPVCFEHRSVPTARSARAVLLEDPGRLAAPPDVPHDHEDLRRAEPRAERRAADLDGLLLLLHRRARYQAPQLPHAQWLPRLLPLVEVVGADALALPFRPDGRLRVEMVRLVPFTEGEADGHERRAVRESGDGHPHSHGVAPAPPFQDRTRHQPGLPRRLDHDLDAHGAGTASPRAPVAPRPRWSGRPRPSGNAGRGRTSRSVGPPGPARGHGGNDGSPPRPKARRPSARSDRIPAFPGAYRCPPTRWPHPILRRQGPAARRAPGAARRPREDPRSSGGPSERAPY